MLAIQPSSARRIRVDPVFDAFYQGFYLLGIRQIAKPERPAYTNEGFPPSKDQHCLNFTVGPERLRVSVDTQDRPGVYPVALQWCHVYGKINLDAKAAASVDSRVVPIGPSFGVRAWTLLAAAATAARLHAVAGPRLTRAREHYANFWRQWRYRAPLDEFEPGPARRDFVFSLASLWADDPECNLARAAFLRTAKSIPDLTVEGGFAPRERGDVPGFEDLALTHRYSFGRYLRGVRHSAFVFNTPACFGCLGWKLGEFLALGKAIISLPLDRALPSPLEHGRHIHFVDGSPESIRDAIERMRRDEPYRRRLELEARQYFERFLRPERVVERLMKAASK